MLDLDTVSEFQSCLGDEKDAELELDRSPNIHVYKEPAIPSQAAGVGPLLSDQLRHAGLLLTRFPCLIPYSAHLLRQKDTTR